MKNISPIFIKSLLFLLCLSIYSTAYGVKIVRLNIDYGTPPTTHTLDLELFDDVTPLTTSNFLNYINSGKYDGSFFTRSIQGFVIQSGGYTFRPVDPLVNFLHPSDTPPVAIPLEASSPVSNEYALTTITNQRGTIAMAKVSHDPNSATTEWFINMADNREALDSQNGGFTVFGQVIDEGMIIANEISIATVAPVAGTILGSAFSDLPVINWIFGDPMYKENLYMITNTSTINRPILRITPTNETFPLDVAGDSSYSEQFITLTNTGNESLTIDTIATPSISEYTIIDTNNCVGLSLEPVSIIPEAKCDIKVQFTATSEITYTDVVDIAYSSNSNSYTAPLILFAEGTPAEAVLHTNKTTLAFSPTDQTASTNKTIIVKNKGGANLTISSIISNNSDYAFDSSDCTTGTLLSPDQTCNLVVTFSPTSISTSVAITGTLTISSSAGAIDVSLSGFGVDPIISTPPAPVDFGSASIDQPVFLPIAVANNGDTGLILDTFTFTGEDADMFSFVTNCPDLSMTSGSSCVIQVTFSPTSTGSKTATLVINSNDADNPQLALELTGMATGTSLDSDYDGIEDTVEQQAVNNGDGNNDDISDDIQNNVASFILGIDKKVTLVSDNVTLQSNTGETFTENTVLSSVKGLTELPAEFPRDVLFTYGGISFNTLLTKTSAGATFNVGLYLPLDVEVDKFYRYGPTPDDPTPHLYDFTYDNTTGLGARVIGTVTVKSESSGDAISRNMVIITYKDGGLGDDDLLPNSRIVNSISAFSTISITKIDSSGAVSINYILLMMLVLTLTRIKNKKHQQQ